jgi:hypothetical protein
MSRVRRDNQGKISGLHSADYPLIFHLDSLNVLGRGKDILIDKYGRDFKKKP